MLDYRISVDREKPQVTVRASGKVLANNLIPLFKELFRTDGFGPGIPELWVTSNLELEDFDMSEINLAQDEINKDNRGTAPVAVVVDDEASRRIINLWNDLLTSHDGRVRRIFGDEAEAQTWLDKQNP